MPSVLNFGVHAASKRLSAFGVLAMLLAAAPAPAQIPSTQISTDTFTNSTSQHETEVEPASYAVGSTIVSVFQVGRFTDGGASDIGFSTSTNGGTTWTEGNLPGITSIEGSGPYDRASDTSVIFNSKFKLWLAETLAISNSGGAHGQAVLVSSSKDGIHWNNPATVSIVEAGGFYDKPWIGCDNTASSPHYGNCYVEWDDFSLGDRIEMSTSTDGGTTWSTKQSTSGNVAGTGGIPLVQPNGTVIVPLGDAFLSSILAFQSTDGGTTWTRPITVATIDEHAVAGNMRAVPLPAAQIDAAGTVYVMWADCRFRSGCSSNDIVYSTSTNGTTWSAVTRVPIDATTNGADHFTPGFAIKPGTSGSTAHLAVMYNFFPKASCGTSCNLSVGYVSSANGGATWTAPKVLTRGMNPSWLPATTSGQMSGDYMASSYVAQKVHGVFASAQAPVGGTFNQAMQTNQTGLPGSTPEEPQFSSANDKPAPGVHSQVHRTKPHRDDGKD
ncbi:MAG TPA: sialidase family protein [Candidatus Sulfotelmatobacter sp.]